MVNCGAGTAQPSGGGVGEGPLEPAGWVWVRAKSLSASGLTFPWIKGTMTGLTGSGAAGGCSSMLSVALSLTHQLLVSMLTKPHMLLAVFFSEHLVPLNVCYKCLWLQQPGLDCEESWVLKNWCFWTVVLEKALESSLDCKEIQPVHPKGDQSWIFIGRTDAEAETPILWPSHAKSWLIGKDSDAGRDWGQDEKGTTEDEMAGWHHWLDGCEPEWTPGVGDGQKGLVCCYSWGRKESDTTERLMWSDLIWYTWQNITISSLTIHERDDKPKLCFFQDCKVGLPFENQKFNSQNSQEKGKVPYYKFNGCIKMFSNTS